MAKAKGNDEPEKPKYVMPDVGRGDVVLWHDGYGAPATAMALVTATGSDTITVAVLGEGYQNFIVKTGVRHYAHPDKQLIEQTDQGVWSHRLRWQKLQDRLNFLEQLVNDLSEGVQAAKRPPPPPQT